MKQSQSAIRVFSYVAGALLVGGLTAVCWKQQTTIAALREQQLSQEEKQVELDRLRAENQTLQRLRNQQDEIESLRVKNKDLLRLRNEVTQLRNRLQELEVLRAANAQLLQAVHGAGNLQSNQMAMFASARKMGAILGISVRLPASGQPGVEVLGIDPNSPVATSGLAAGDVIVALDGQRVLSPGELQAHMLTRKPGETVALDILRTNAALRFQMQTRAWPE